MTRRHTTLWMNHKISANIEFAVKHADALTRIVPSYACWHIADNGSHAAPECGPKTLGRLQKMGIELWPEVSVSKASMVSGSWKPALSASGTLGPIMKAWGWRGVMIDEEEPNDTPQCRREHCGDPEAHCSACLPKVSAPQYGAFLTEFAAALKVHGLGLQITAGMSGPVPIIEDRQGWIENYTAAMCCPLPFRIRWQRGQAAEGAHRAVQSQPFSRAPKSSVWWRVPRAYPERD